jgi:hypothetical protein
VGWVVAVELSESDDLSRELFFSVPSLVSDLSGLCFTAVPVAAANVSLKSVPVEDGCDSGFAVALGRLFTT